MVFEKYLSYFIALGVFIWLVTVGVRIFRAFRRSDPVHEAHERLEKAKRDAEVVKLQKETEKVYEHLFEEKLDESEKTERTGKS